MSTAHLLVHIALLLALPPFLLGVINKTKAWFAGRSGPPLLQAYFDIARLARKGAVYSTTATWIFRAGPVLGLATVLLAGLLVPFAAENAPLGFEGDIIAFAYLLGLGRFFTMAAALDTGSSFEGMGASREGAFASFAEPALLLGLAIVCVPAKSASFGAAWTALPWSGWGSAHPAYIVAALALFAVLLTENSRIPIDDPNTHLELTMVHEVMVLDHSGPDFAFILYGSSLKLFVIGALLVRLVVPLPAGWAGVGVFALGQLVLAALVGVVESSMARLRLSRVPQFLVGAAVLAGIGLSVFYYRGAP